MVKNTKKDTSKKTADKVKTRSSKNIPNDMKVPSNILESKDIDQMLEFLKNSKRKKNQDIMDLDPYFIDQHVNGVEMFMKLAIKLEPENPMHHYNYALFLENQKSYNMAKSEFETAIKLDKNNETYYTNYGDLLFLLNDFKGAVKQYQAAINLKPDNVHVWTNLGILYNNNKEPKKAEKAFKMAIKFDPNYPFSYLNLFELYKRYGKKNEAKALWQKYKTLEIQDLDFNILHLDKEVTKVTNKKKN